MVAEEGAALFWKGQYGHTSRYRAPQGNACMCAWSMACVLKEVESSGNLQQEVEQTPVFSNCCS